ncbi:MAG: ATP-binding protein [Saprospiraceae bacterium]
MKSLFWVIIFIVCSLSLLGQSIEKEASQLLNEIKIAKSDSTKIRLYFNLSDLYLNYQPSQAIKYSWKALFLSKKKKRPKDIATAYNKIFRGHYFQGAIADSLFNYVQLLEKQVIANKDTIAMIDVYWSYSFYYGYIGQSDKDMTYALKALKQLRKYAPSSEREAKLLNNIAVVLADNQQYGNALNYYQEALPMVEDKLTKGNILFNMGTIYTNFFNKRDSAQFFFDEALQLYRDTNNSEGIASALVAKATYYSKQQPNKAEDFFFEALKIANDYNLRFFLHEIYTHLANHYYFLKKYDSAKEYGEKALASVDKRKFYNTSTTQNIYHLLQNVYVETGQFKKAYHIQKDWIILKDSLSNIELLGKIETLKTEYEVEKKEAENKLLKAEKEIIHKNARIKIFLALGIIFILLLIIAFVYRINHQRKRLNETLERKVTERTKDLEQANYELRTFNYIASHDIKEPIRVIGGHVGLIFKKLPNDLKEKLGDYFDTIKRSTTQLYTLVEDFAYYSTLSKDEVVKTEPIDLNLLMFNVIDNLQESIEKYNGEVLIDYLPTINSSNTFLFTALKNLIENGLKYNQADKRTVAINYQSTETQHQIIVKDNGIGIESQYHEKIFEMFKRLHNRGEYEGSGIGLAIVKLVVSKLNGGITLQSEVNRGSIFVISLPKT